MKKNNLPVFPLGLVALPGTIQNLQIFEPRYINMVKDCMEQGHGFVIVFQKQIIGNNENEISKKGCYVEIIDFNNLPNGLLGITVKSVNKVSIKNLTQLEDFNSADSVAYHLAGLIPISWPHKQSLLEAFDASQRLSILSKYIEEISSS